MSIAATIPAAVIEMVVGFLLPMLLPAARGDVAAAGAAARCMLAEYEPHTGQELRLAADAILGNLRSLAALGQPAAPGAPASETIEMMKLAAGYARSARQAERRLEALQRARRTAADPERVAATTPTQGTIPTQAAASAPPEARRSPVRPEPDDSLPYQQPAAPAGSETARAEAEFNAAAKLLRLMQEHCKDAPPPPHSKAAQDLDAQQRIVDAALARLQQARARSDVAGLPAGATHAAA